MSQDASAPPAMRRPMSCRATSSIKSGICPVWRRIRALSGSRSAAVPSKLSSSTFAEAASSERSQIRSTSEPSSQSGVYSVRQVSSTSNGRLVASDIRASTTVSLWPSIQCKSSNSNTVGRDETTRSSMLRTASIITRRRSKGSRSRQRGSPTGWSRTELSAAGQSSA